MSDLTKLPRAIILDLINADNEGLELLESEVTFADPEVEVGERNTSVLLTAAPSGRFSGTRTIYYNRLDLDEDIVSTGDAVFEKTGAIESIADLLDAINSRFNLNLTLDEVSTTTFPEFEDTPGESHTVTITALATSLVYIGEVEVTLTIATVDLATAIAVNELNGLTYEPEGD